MMAIAPINTCFPYWWYWVGTPTGYPLTASITAGTLSGTVATIDWATANLNGQPFVGETVTISGATPSGLNGTWLVASVPTTTSLTFASTVTGTVSAAGTITFGSPIVYSSRDGALVSPTDATYVFWEGPGGTNRVAAAMPATTALFDTLLLSLGLPVSGLNITNSQQSLINYANTYASNLYLTSRMYTLSPSVRTIQSTSSLSGTVATIRWSNPLPVTPSNGASVVIAGATPSGLDGTWTMTGTPTSTTCTFASSTTGSVSTAGTITFADNVIVNAQSDAGTLGELNTLDAWAITVGGNAARAFVDDVTNVPLLINSPQIIALLADVNTYAVSLGNFLQGVVAGVQAGTYTTQAQIAALSWPT